jgi:aspartate racemase
MKKIGLIGGITWESSLVYYKLINKEINRIRGGLHSAECIMYSFDFEKIAQLQNAGEWGLLAEKTIDAAKKIEEAGADFLVICSNTMHKIVEDVQARINIPILHITDALIPAIREQGLNQVGLLGTRFTMEEAFIKKQLYDKGNISAIIPSEEERIQVHNIIYKELAKGIFRDVSRERLLTIIDRLSENGAQGIILGCTELPLIVDHSNTNAILFDTTTLHSVKSVEWALSELEVFQGK